MNARVPDPSSPNGRSEGPTVADAAAEFRAAGEALVRAASVMIALSHRGGRPSPARGAPRSNSSLPVGERLSSKQLGAIRAAARRAGLSREGLADLLEQVAGKNEPTELSRSDASLVLDKLSAMTGYAR
ncbi:MAG TPA: hypothetical protein VG937_10705 [Polyangiaceae bacterium]|nr:hypothetical protein [Polyangiaceae bacterium]